MAAVASPSDRIPTDISHLETADLLQNLSLDSQAKTTEVPDRAKKLSSIPFEPIKSSNLATGTAKPFNRSATPFNLNPNASSFNNGYPTSTYYYGGYDGQSNEWTDFLRYVNHENMAHNLHQARPTTGMGQSFGYLNRMYPNNMTYGHYGNAYRSGSGYGSYGYDSWKMRGWPVVEKYNKSRGRGNGYGKENMAGLNELNKGPRAKGFKSQEGSVPVTLAIRGQNLPSSENSKEDNLSSTQDKEQYNRDDFPENYLEALFFVIKSYSEDDVHKSIKYNVWASTPNGNKKLDAAYSEAKEKPNCCPVFLLFSVNTSGQFVGIAEMVGPVDFNKTVEYWQQDKWIGCFPVKWHIVKDVPNSLLRHITLENNENKPVTNSRDTQEVNLKQGIEILKIFKNHSNKTCILDDFGFYESRQKIMQENKAKQRQSHKQVSDGKPAETVARDQNNKDVTVGTNKLQKASDAVLLEEPLVTPAESLVHSNGEVKILEINESSATVENASKGAKTVVSSEKRVVPNGVASAC